MMLFCFILCLNNVIFAQITGEDFVEKNDPYNVKKLSISLIPIDIDVSDFGSMMSYKLSGNISWQLKQRALLSYNYTYGYSVVGFDDPINFSTHEITGRLFFKTVEKKTEIKWILDTKTDYGFFANTVTQTYIEIPYQKLVSRGVRAGYYTHKNFISFSTYNVEDRISTMVSTQNAFLGYSLFVVKDVEMKDPKTEFRRYRSRKNEWYLDVVYLTSIDLKFFDDGYKKFPFGFRTGWTTTSAKKFGTTLTYEIGIQPGVSSSILNNLYINMKYGITFPF